MIQCFFDDSGKENDQTNTPEIPLANEPERDELKHKALKSWIDDVIVPALVKRFLREKNLVLKEEPIQKKL